LLKPVGAWPLGTEVQLIAVQSPVGSDPALAVGVGFGDGEIDWLAVAVAVVAVGDGANESVSLGSIDAAGESDAPAGRLGDAATVQAARFAPRNMTAISRPTIT
jgi:hypothetical protein